MLCCVGNIFWNIGFKNFINSYHFRHFSSRGNRNFDKIFVYVFVSNTKEVPGVRKVFICFEISKIFLNLPKKFDNLTVIKSGNSLVLEKKLCKVSWNHLKCKPEWMLFHKLSISNVVQFIMIKLLSKELRVTFLQKAKFIQLGFKNL